MRIDKAIVFGTVLSACWGAVAAAELSIYQRQEPGIDPYPSRIVVTERYMRMDDNRDDGGYVLFDRDSGVVYSVEHEEGTVMEIHPRAVGLDSPVPLELGEEEVPAREAPSVAGKRPRHHVLTVNGESCYQVMSVADLLPETVAARRAFRRTMAGEHARILPRIPADMQDPCDLAGHTFAPARHLSWGLPIHEWDGRGNAQALVRFDPAFEPDPALFELPEGYQHYRPDGR